MLALTVETSFLWVLLIACVRICGWQTIRIQNVEIGSIWIYAKFIEERLEIIVFDTCVGSVNSCCVGAMFTWSIIIIT